MTSTRRRRKTEGPRWLPTTQRCTRSSAGLRGAPAPEIRFPPSFNQRPSARKDVSTTTSKSRSSKGHTSSRWPVHDIASPRRSSLRRALRESLKLSYATSPAAPSALPNPAPVELQVPPREPENPTPGVQRGIKAGSAAARSSALPRVPPSKVTPQRSSLRRAIRESQKAIDTAYKNPIPPTYYPKLDTAQSTVPSLQPVEKQNAETQNQAVRGKNAHRTASLSSNCKGGAISPTTPQRSSLRRAVRESLLDMGSGGVSPGQGIILKNTIETSPPNSDSQSGGVISLSDSPAVLSDTSFTPLEVGYNLETPSRLSRTSSISSIAASPGPLTPLIPRLLAALRPRKAFIPKSYVVTQSPTSHSSFSLSKSSSKIVSTLDLRHESESPTTVARHQLPSMASEDWSIAGSGKPERDPSDSKSASARNGWHQVREIANEAPNGLYLVEWEGLDPRTGVKWPASWVMAKDVSESAIRHWEERKHQMLLGSKRKR
ncbi:hypothetical protein F4823DRAFT_628639 [Ustulina deusta]|nr:hypothetical protein F4823DRAFT_628639 [Ustulina deusta]